LGLVRRVAVWLNTARMPSSSARALVVSLHDVSPRTQPACARVLAELAELGVRKASLLVIPDHHHAGPIEEDAGFCAWLRQLAGAGHEIVLHGYFHERARRSRETARQKLITRIYTADEGEFYDLDRPTARELVSRGLEILQRVGCESRGFIAPAWLLSREAEEALRELGVEYTTTLGSVRDLQHGREWRSQSLVWSVRRGWRRAASRVWNALLFRRLRTSPLLRISIHPVDLAHAAIWRQISSLTTRALADREAMPYHRWVEVQSDASPRSILNAQLP
jgi:predicted deacetylase